MQVLGISVDPLLAQEVGAGFEELKANSDLTLGMGELMQLQQQQQHMSVFCVAYFRNVVYRC